MPLFIAIYENAVFDVFLTGKLIFRRTDPIQVFATIDFSPFHAAFLTAILLHGYLPEHRQHAGHDAGVAAAQQTDNGAPPDKLPRFLFEEKASPDVMLNVETTTRDGDVDMQELIELAVIGAQGTEYADLNTLFTCPREPGAGDAAE